MADRREFRVVAFSWLDNVTHEAEVALRVSWTEGWFWNRSYLSSRDVFRGGGSLWFCAVTGASVRDQVVIDVLTAEWRRRRSCRG